MTADILGLAGKHALVLGGGQGMGEETVLALAAQGVRVAVADRDVGRAQHVAAKAGPDALALPVDVLDDAALAATIAQADGQMDGIDILINIVGLATFKPALDLTGEDWDTDYRRNTRYVFLACQAFARAAIIRGRPGAIVMMSSMSGVRSARGHAAYGVFKEGNANLTRTLAVEWASAGIRVNAITPGSILVPSFPDSPEGRAFMKQSLVPMGRSGETREITGPMLFLVSDMGSYVTGHNLYVDGGWGAANLF